VGLAAGEGAGEGDGFAVRASSLLHRHCLLTVSLPCLHSDDGRAVKSSNKQMNVWYSSSRAVSSRSAGRWPLALLATCCLHPSSIRVCTFETPFANSFAVPSNIQDAKAKALAI
jgi:hypothetical protein